MSKNFFLKIPEESPRVSDTFLKNLNFSRKNISEDVHKNIIDKFLPNNCEVRGCVEPWNFSVKTFDNNKYNCKKYCVNHPDKWLNTLFINPYYIEFNNKIYNNTILNYNLIFYVKNINNNLNLIQIQILINSDDTISKISYDDFSNKIHKENYTKLEIIDIIKNNINNLYEFNKQIIIKEIGYLRDAHYKIYNKYSKQLSEFDKVIYLKTPSM